MIADEEAAPPPRIRVWDLPTRLFHWLLVILFAVQWWSGKAERIEIHVAAGLTLLGLIVFRLLWGLFGGSTARFSHFVRGPGAVIAYLRGRRGPAIGHNPIGGWSVILILLLLAVQIGLGLFASDEDYLDTGPLAHLVSFESARALAHNHEILFNILLGLAGLHVLAVLFYLLVRRDDRVMPMLGGTRTEVAGAEPLRPAPLWRFAGAVALAGGVVAAVLAL